MDRRQLPDCLIGSLMGRRQLLDHLFIKIGNEFVTKAILSLASEYYGENKLRRKDVRPTKLVDFEGTRRHHNAYIMPYEPKKDGGKDAGSTWQLVYGFNTQETWPQ